MAFGRHGLSRRALERLLDGAPPPAGDATSAALARVLDAASAPAAPGEQRGEAAARAEFRAARPRILATAAASVAIPAGPARPDRGRLRLLGRRVRIALLAVIIAVLVAGVAVAAPAGFLPGLPHHHHPAVHPSRSPSPSPSVGPSTSPSPSVSPSPSTSPSPSPSTSISPPATSPGPSAAPSPSVHGDIPPEMHGLCRAWSNAVKHGRAGKDDPSFDRLVAAAGGRDQVPVYCAAVAARK